MDISWLQSSGSNKENHNNTLTTILSNTSFQNANYTNITTGILTCSSSNAINNSNINDSFDCDKIKLDVYDKTIQKLVNENKSLRKRVKKLTELARSKEEQLMEAFNDACEQKRKNEEKIKLEYNAQLQSYYDCFLQIEKENDALKIKIEQMKLKILEKERKQNEDPFIPEVKNDQTIETEHSTSKEISVKNLMDQELSEVNKSLQMIIEQATSPEDQAEDETDLVKVNAQSEDKNADQVRISELELELDTINKKLAGIEASLARWIFRACDYKYDLSKSNEKCMNLELRISELINDNLQLNERLNAKDIESHAKVEELEKLLQLKNEQLIGSEKLSDLNMKMIDQLKDKIGCLEGELKVYAEKIVNKVDNSVQTEESTSSSQPTVVKKPSTVGIVLQTAAKINQMTANNTTPIFSSNHSTQAHNSSPTIQSSPDPALQKRVDTLTNELSQLRLKMDSLILERTSLKCRNDELIAEIDKLNTKTSNPATFTKSLYVKSTQTVILSANALIQTDAELAKVQTASQNALSNEAELLSKLKAAHIKEINDFQQQLNNNIDSINTLTESNKLLKQQCEELKAEIESKLRETTNEYENRLAELNFSFKTDKQISDTIIQQQKKLLEFLMLDKKSRDGSDHHHNNHRINSLFGGKKKNNPLLANLHKTTNKQYLTGGKPSSIVEEKKIEQIPENVAELDVETSIKQIETELNSNYVTYSELSKHLNEHISKSNIRNPQSITEKDTHSKDNQIKPRTPQIHPNRESRIKQKQQIHVFITGLNTSPTYCHVCQQLIPLIAYASKCQLCSFTCHSTCSSLNSSKSQSKPIKSKSKTNVYTSRQLSKNDSTPPDPFKYCNVNYLYSCVEYNNYINRLIDFSTNYSSSMIMNLVNNKNFKSLVILNDYLYINIDNEWKKVWTILKLNNERQLQPQLELYQSKKNLKPFDTIYLINDSINIETNIKLISKILGDKKYGEETELESTEMINYEQSSLVLLLFNLSKKFFLKLAFNNFTKKNIWYDAIQSCILVAKSTAVSSLSKKIDSSLTAQVDQFKLFSLNKVLKPFLELCDTTVNSYCFINENLIALACDDGLYALNYVKSNQQANTLSLVKIEPVESAHKLYYDSNFGKLCFIGNKSRQFLSIDIQELSDSLTNSSRQSLVRNRDNEMKKEENDYENDDYDYEDNFDDFGPDENKSVWINLEHIHNIDRCHLLECCVSATSSGFWYIAIATPENIYILLYNKQLEKFSPIKTIQTQNDAPCTCLKFALNSQLIYACGKDFYRMDMTYLQPVSVMDLNSVIASMGSHAKQLDNLVEPNQQQPLSVCAISLPNYEAMLFCYENYGLFMNYNTVTASWQPIGMNSSSTLPNGSKKTSSSSSINSTNSISAIVGSANTLAATNPTSSTLIMNFLMKWPRGNCLAPLQIEFDSSNLHLFYNDSIVTYRISYENELLCVKKTGITYIYKPRYLNVFHTNGLSASTGLSQPLNCIIISNRRPTDLTELEKDDANTMMDCTDENDYFFAQQDFNTSSRSLSARMSRSNFYNNPLVHDLYDKICLSYFSPSFHE